MEEWKDIKGYEGQYQISNLGRVKSLARQVNSGCYSGYISKEKMLNLVPDKDGYLKTSLSLNGIRKSYRINRLVAQAFISNPNNYPQVNHISGIKTDNIELRI